MIGKLLRNVVAPIADATSDAYIARQEAKVRIRQAKLDLKLARINAKAKLAEKSVESAGNYDMQVLRNRAQSHVDDFLVLVFVGFVAIHFHPYFQPYLDHGWMMIKEAAFWFEYAIITIIASTLGGMQILRLMISKIPSFKFGRGANS